MEEVQSISKDERNSQQKFNFRGIDTVMNTVGPVLRRHKVIVVPGAVKESSERYETTPKGDATRGTAMVNRVVQVDFTVYGPGGDHFTGSAFGEAADSGDKAMAKAHSVAYRTFLLQALTIPTDETDPDAESHDRAPARQRRPAESTLSDANAEGRARLRTLCDEQDWDARTVAGIFSTNSDKQTLATADNATIDGFILLLKQGIITVPGKPYKEPSSEPAEPEPEPAIAQADG